MIRIRKLEEKDIPFMIEWMQDEELTKNLQADFKKIANYKSQLEFINNSISDSSKNFAIVDDNDEYQGSISLKNIDVEKSEAEFAICIRKCAQGKHISFEATNEILMYAFQELGLNRVYLYVSSSNERANGFYNKFGFTFEKTDKQLLEIKGKKHDINWYYIEKKGFITLHRSREELMQNVKRITFQEITDNRGELVAIEHPKQLEFPLNRVYYMYNVGEGIVRGKHSHRDLEQILIAVSGEVTIITRTPFGEQKYILNKPNEGLYIGNMIWREMEHFSKDAVLMVLASKKYDPDDYIRSYDEYLTKANEYFDVKKLDRRKD